MSDRHRFSPGHVVDATERVRVAVGQLLDRIDEDGGECGYERTCPCCAGTLAVVMSTASRTAAIGHTPPYCAPFHMALAELNSMRAGVN